MILYISILNMWCLCINLYYITSITAPQDAHKRLVLQVYCYFTRPEEKALEMRVLCCKLTWSKALEFRVMWLLKNKEEADISLSIINSKHVFTSHVYVRGIRPRALNTCSNDFICRYIERVTSCKRKNRFGSRCEGWEWCSWWREICWCTKVSFLG